MYIDTHMIIYMYINIHIYSETEQNCLSESEGLHEAEEVKKMLENEIYWNSPSIHEYDTTYYRVRWWILGEHGAENE
jgi:hypothetical protein